VLFSAGVTEWTWPDGTSRGDSVTACLEAEHIFWSGCADDPEVGQFTIALQSLCDFLEGGPPAEVSHVPVDIALALRRHAEQGTATYAPLVIHVVAVRAGDEDQVGLMFVQLDGRSIVSLHCDSRPSLPLDIFARRVRPGAHRLESSVEIDGRRFEGDFAVETLGPAITELTLRVSRDGVELG
jgi:hypothetical protein